jgi:hypothetical protein
MKIILIPGTRDWSPLEDSLNLRWWQRDGDLTRLWERHGFQRYGWDYHGIDHPQWATVLSGTAWADKDHRTWYRGAFGQETELEKLFKEDRNVICHSHGGNLGVILALEAQKYIGGLNSLITICTPVRKDMQEMYEAVTCPWLHIYDGNFWTNRMQWFGARLRFEMKMPGIAQNLKLEGIGHSELVRDPLRFREIHVSKLMPFVKAQRD